MERCYSNLILDLEVQYKEKPFRMFGLKVKTSLVNSLVVGFFSFIFSLFYTFFLSDAIASL